MPDVIYALLHETPQGAFVSDVYRDRDFALYAARNAAEGRAADLRTAEAAFTGAYVSATAYCVATKTCGSETGVLIVHSASNEIETGFRWSVHAQEVVDRTLSPFASAA